MKTTAGVCLCVCLLVLVAPCLRAAAPRHRLNLAAILKDIPEHERIDYLKFQILRVQQERVKPSTTLPARLATQIFDYFMENRRVNGSQVKALGKVVCFDDPPVCIDIDDPSIHP